MTQNVELTWHQRNAIGHRWMGTDRHDTIHDMDGAPIIVGVDECLRCGVTAPAHDVDGTCLPDMCPGPDVRQPHDFTSVRPWYGGYVSADGTLRTYGGWTVACQHCGLHIDENTTPNSVDWECHADDWCPNCGRAIENCGRFQHCITD